MGRQMEQQTGLLTAQLTHTADGTTEGTVDGDTEGMALGAVERKDFHPHLESPDPVSPVGFGPAIPPDPFEPQCWGTPLYNNYSFAS